MSSVELVMSQMREIAIDLDVHRRIEAERNAFAETPNDILRRMLGLGREIDTAGAKKNSKVWRYVRGDFVIELPEGTKLRATYSGQQIEGEIIETKFMVRGKSYKSPSPAVLENVKTKKGSTPSLNGYTYWRCQVPGSGTWLPLDNFRQYS